MLKLDRTVMAAVAAAFVALPGAAQKSIKDYLPANTAMVVSVPDLETSISEFSQMPLAKMWREDEVQDFVADAMDMLREQYAVWLERGRKMHEDGQLPISPDEILKLRLRGGTFAVTGLDFKMGDFGPIPNIGLVMHLDFGDTAEKWFGLVQMGLGMMEQQAGDEMIKSVVSVGDIKLMSYAPNMPEEIPMSLNVAMVDKGLLIGTVRSEVETILKGMQAGTPVLGTSEGYLNNAKHLQMEGAEAEVYMRPGPFLDLLVDVLRIAGEEDRDFAMIDVDGVDRALEALGLRAIQSVGSTSAYDDGVSVTKGYVVAPAPLRKGLLAGSNKNLDLSFLRWVPKDAVSFSSSTVDPMGIYDAIVGALKAYNPDFADQVLGAVGEYEQQLGFSIQEDLFGSIGDTFITWSMPMGAITAAPEMAFLLKVKDQERLVKTLMNVTKMTDGAVDLEKVERRGITAYQLRVNIDPTGGGGMNPFDIINPTFSFNEGYMVAGFSVSDVKRVFKRMEREDDPTGDIRGNKEFAPYLQKLPENLQGLAFTDWKASFEGIYQTLTGVLAFLPMNDDIPIDLSLLPDSVTLTQHLFGSVSFNQADGNGYSTTAISPFGPEMLIVAVAAGAGVAGAVMAFQRF